MTPTGEPVFKGMTKKRLRRDVQPGRGLQLPGMDAGDQGLLFLATATSWEEALATNIFKTGTCLQHPGPCLELTGF